MNVASISVRSNSGYMYDYLSSIPTILLERSLEDTNIRVINFNGDNTNIDILDVDLTTGEIERGSVGGYSVQFRVFTLLPNYVLLDFEDENRRRRRWNYYSRARKNLQKRMTCRGFLDLSSHSLTLQPSPFNIEGYILQASAVPFTNEVLLISHNSVQKDLDDEAKEKKGETIKPKKAISNKFERFLVVVDFLKEKILHRIQLPYLYEKEDTNFGNQQLHVENDYVFVKVRNKVLAYDVKNMYQQVNEFSDFSLTPFSFFCPIPISYELHPPTSSHHHHHNMFNRGRKSRSGMMIPSTFACSRENKKPGNSAIQIDPVTGQCTYDKPSNHAVLKDLTEAEIKSMKLLRDRNLGFFMSSKHSSEETYLSVYDFISETVIRSFTRPILPRKQGGLASQVVWEVGMVDFGNNNEECEVLVTVYFSTDGEIKIFGYLGKEEMEEHREKMMFLFDLLLTADNNDHQKGVKFVEYMLGHGGIRNEQEKIMERYYIEKMESKEMFIRLLLGRHVWKFMDPKTYLEFFEFFEVCGLEKMKVMLTREYYQYQYGIIKSYPKSIAALEKNKKEKNNCNNSVENQHEEKKIKIRQFILAFKNCLQKYEMLSSSEKIISPTEEETDIINFDIHKPPFKSVATLCCYNVLKSFHEFYIYYDLEKMFWSVISEEKEIWDSFKYYQVITRLESHPSLQQQQQEKEKEEVEGEEEEEDYVKNPKKMTSSSTIYECYRNQLKYLFDTKYGSNITLECTSEEENNNNNNIIHTIKCHKELLIFRSKFIKMMLSFPGQESLEESTHGTLRIELLKYEQLKLYIEYIYLGRTSDEDIKFGDLIKLINFAEMFQETQLAAYCAEKIRFIAFKLSNIKLEEEKDDDDEEEDEEEFDFDEIDVEETELTKQLKMTGCYLENEKIVWNVMVSCFWEFLSKEEIAYLINVSRVEHGLEELDFSCFLLFPDM